MPVRPQGLLESAAGWRNITLPAQQPRQRIAGEAAVHKERSLTHPKRRFRLDIDASAAIGEPNTRGRGLHRLFGGDALVVAVASKRLVASFSGENYFVPPPDRVRQSKGRDRGAIGKRFVVMPEQPLKFREYPLRIDRQHLLTQPKMLRHALGVRKIGTTVRKIRGKSF